MLMPAQKKPVPDAEASKEAEEQHSGARWRASCSQLKLLLQQAAKAPAALMPSMGFHSPGFPLR